MQGIDGLDRILGFIRELGDVEARNSKSACAYGGRPQETSEGRRRA